ncbi:MAG TPA: DUF4118 domain-containing protein, partial [Acidimicrobiales bacterium]|nr:DUF4118 domain-containing protein [Acidimicrobiales bacterium]
MRPHSSFRYHAIAAAAVALTFALKAAIEGLVGPGPPLLVYLPAVTFGAWLGGLGPGLTATGLSALICLIAHLEPIGTLRMDVANDRFRLVVFLAEGVLLSGSMEMLHAARRRSEASIREARRYQEELEASEGRLRAIL